MKISALTSQSFRSIWSNKVRSGLTILGIVIGIAAVISLVGLGKGLQANVTSRISSLGTTDISIRSQDPNRQTAQRQMSFGGPGGGQRGGFAFLAGNTETLTVDDYAAIRKTANVALASPEASTDVAAAKTNDASTATQYQLYGIDSDYFAIKKYQLAAGTLPTAAQVSNAEPVVVIGETAAQELYGSIAVIGQKIYLKDSEFTIVGVLKSPDTNTSGPEVAFNNPANNIYTGYKQWLTLNGKTKFSTVDAQSTNEDNVEATANAIKNTIMANHAITDSAKADVGVSTSKDLLNTVSNVVSSFTATLAGIAGISLLVGGIGIMNIMLVTVTERTREIGLRRAVGAKNRHVVLQFMLEAVLLTMIGGVLGILVGVVFGSHASSIVKLAGPGRGVGREQVKVVIDASTMLLAVGISAAIGVIFGLFPALKAARLDPVDALRYE